MTPQFQEHFVKILAEKLWRVLEDGKIPVSLDFEFNYYVLNTAKEAYELTKGDRKIRCFHNKDVVCEKCVAIAEEWLRDNKPQKEEPLCKHERPIALCYACPPTQPKERWRAVRGGSYWYISGGTVLYTTDLYSYADAAVWNDFNYFQTKAQAEVALEKVKELLKSINQ